MNSTTAPPSLSFDAKPPEPTRGLRGPEQNQRPLAILTLLVLPPAFPSLAPSLVVVPSEGEEGEVLVERELAAQKCLIAGISARRWRR